MTDTVVAGPARPGDLLGGRYRLDQLIGEGGMGSVWRAVDTALGRTVAVKVFWGDASAADAASRRDSEKRLLAAVSHPSLVTLFDAHIAASGASYLVMEYVDGGTLGAMIQRGPIDPRDAASLATDLGEALHVVHAAGIIHRDVKPANILLRPPLTPEHTFRAVLADFGIAYVADTTRVTAPGMAIGTAAYISPEQARGHEPTPASDIYSLGLVLLEALSGRRAYPAQTPVEAIAARLSSSPTVPGEWGYGWRSLLTAMTALDPADRPDALEVARRGRALDTADAVPALTVPVPLAPLPAVPAATRVLPVDEGPASVLPVGRRRTVRARRRPRALVALSGAAAAVVVVGALGAWFGLAADGETPAPALTPEVVEPVEPKPLVATTPEPAVEPATEQVVPATEQVVPATDDQSEQGESEDAEESDDAEDSGKGSGKGAEKAAEKAAEDAAKKAAKDKP